MSEYLSAFAEGAIVTSALLGVVLGVIANIRLDRLIGKK